MLYLIIFSFFIIILLLVVAALELTMNISVEYVKNGEGDRFTILFYTLGGLFKYKYEIPLIDLDETGVKMKRSKKKLKKEDNAEKNKVKASIIKLIIKSFSFYKANEKLISSLRRYLKGKLELADIKLDIFVGTGDVYYTGLLTGLTWSLAGILLSYIVTNITTHKKHISIKSDFTGIKFNIEFSCIFHVKIVHIIVVRIWMYLYLKKIKKQSKR